MNNEEIFAQQIEQIINENIGDKLSPSHRDAIVRAVISGQDIETAIETIEDEMIRTGVVTPRPVPSKLIEESKRYGMLSREDSIEFYHMMDEIRLKTITLQLQHEHKHTSIIKQLYSTMYNMLNSTITQNEQHISQLQYEYEVLDQQLERILSQARLLNTEIMYESGSVLHELKRIFSKHARYMLDDKRNVVAQYKKEFELIKQRMKYIEQHIEKLQQYNTNTQHRLSHYTNEEYKQLHKMGQESSQQLKQLKE